jgi:redox-sensitive bicupin YhaK (pirin superfamily)
MNEIKPIKRVSKSQPTVEGAGVHLKRAFGFRDVPRLDPFLLLDDFHSDNPADYLAGFPWHPHRGIETITYVLEGEVEHGDSLGNQGVIGPGDVQWMTAGSGIIHQEMPRRTASGRLWGFQLWANLPAAHKMMAPRYREVRADQIPVYDFGGVTLRVISGEVAGDEGPVRDIVIDPEYFDITVAARESYRHAIKPGYTVFIYVIEGEACFDDRRDAYAFERAGTSYFDFDRRSCLIGAESLVEFGDGEAVLVTTETAAVRFLLISGRPLREPVAWYGPIVMNTQAELRQAFDEYHAGTFVKVGGVAR